MVGEDPFRQKQAQLAVTRVIESPREAPLMCLEAVACRLWCVGGKPGTATRASQHRTRKNSCWRMARELRMETTLAAGRLVVSECGSPTTAYASSTHEAPETNQAYVDKVEGRHEVVRRRRRVQDERADNPHFRCSGARLRAVRYIQYNTARCRVHPLVVGTLLLPARRAGLDGNSEAAVSMLPRRMVIHAHQIICSRSRHDI
ncbi:hypothetical protein LY76DRAFT_590173, partial [Colletotrichum caudatum]